WTLLSGLSRQDAGLDRHAMPLGEWLELARAPGQREGPALDLRSDLVRVEAARAYEALDRHHRGIVRLHGEVRRVHAGLLLVGGQRRLRQLCVARGPPAVVEEAAPHQRAVLVDEVLRAHGGAHVGDERRPPQLRPLIVEYGRARAVDLADDHLRAGTLDLGELRREVG